MTRAVQTTFKPVRETKTVIMSPCFLLIKYPLMSKAAKSAEHLVELLLGNGLKYLLYHYKIRESKTWTGVTPGKWKVISDEYPKSKAV